MPIAVRNLLEEETAHHPVPAVKQKGRPDSRPRPYYPKEQYVGGKDVNRDANCAPNVNNPSR